jgi:hypothetical protein
MYINIIYTTVILQRKRKTLYWSNSSIFYRNYISVNIRRL